MNKEKYINKYHEEVEENRKKYIEECGNDIDFDSLCDIETVDAIVGYYIEQYKEDAFATWMENLKYTSKENYSQIDTEITNILKDVQNNE